jgi:hypothetical protein
VANQSWVSLINGGNPSSIGAGTALSTATTATISPCVSPTTNLLNDVAQVNAAGQPLGWYPGMLIRVTAYGTLTTTSTSTTATLELAANKAAGTYVVLASAVGLTTGTTVLTNVNWKLEANIWCTAIAQSGNTCDCQGNMNLFFTPGATPALTANPVALTLTTPPGFSLALPNSGGPTASAVDTTCAQGIALRGILAGANATIQCTSWVVEALD